MQERFSYDELHSNYDPSKDITFGHVEINSVRNKLIHNDVWHNYYKFCLVRNPWDRAVSLFEYLKYEGQNFASFVFNLPNVESIGFYNKKELSQCRPQTDWIPKDIDYVGKVETLESDIDRICEITDRERPEIQKVNITKNREFRHYKEYFPDNHSGNSCRIAIEKFYREDIRRFHYTF
jgi:hypothetical protein